MRLIYEVENDRNGRFIFKSINLLFNKSFFSESCELIYSFKSKSSLLSKIETFYFASSSSSSAQSLNRTIIIQTNINI
jgi:hypothetical protein